MTLPAGGSGARRRVLIVDDDPNVAGTLAAMLEAAYEITLAATFTEAQAAMASVRPHVVLLDLQLPGTPGLEGLKYLRTHHRSVPVIVVSGTVDPEAAATARSVGAFDLLTKPPDVEVLRNLVGQAMRVAPAR